MLRDFTFRLNPKLPFPLPFIGSVFIIPHFSILVKLKEPELLIVEHWFPVLFKEMPLNYDLTLVCNLLRVKFFNDILNFELSGSSNLDTFPLIKILRSRVCLLCIKFFLPFLYPPLDLIDKLDIACVAWVRYLLEVNTLEKIVLFEFLQGG